MASNQLSLFLFLAVIAIILPPIVFATEFIVGDSNGWKDNKFDYQNWASDKVFRVGDILVFQYPVGKHNVFKVNGTGFKECIIPSPELALTTGNDKITLATSGKKWYICGKGTHCADDGQKLSINVEDAAPAPAPTNSGNVIVSSGYQVFMVVAVALGVAIKVVM